MWKPPYRCTVERVGKTISVETSRELIRPTVSITTMVTITVTSRPHLPVPALMVPVKALLKAIVKTPPQNTRNTVMIMTESLT